MLGIKRWEMRWCARLCDIPPRYNWTHLHRQTELWNPTPGVGLEVSGGCDDTQHPTEQLCSSPVEKRTTHSQLQVERSKV